MICSSPHLASSSPHSTPLTPPPSTSHRLICPTPPHTHLRPAAPPPRCTTSPTHLSPIPQNHRPPAVVFSYLFSSFFSLFSYLSYLIFPLFSLFLPFFYPPSLAASCRAQGRPFSFPYLSSANQLLCLLSGLGCYFHINRLFLYLQ